jgi:hypothetical protein
MPEGRAVQEDRLDHHAADADPQRRPITEAIGEEPSERSADHDRRVPATLSGQPLPVHSPPFHPLWKTRVVHRG